MQCNVNRKRHWNPVIDDVELNISACLLKPGLDMNVSNNTEKGE